MAYSTPSPSDSWSSSFSDCGTSATSWCAGSLDYPITPSIPYASPPAIQKFSVTSAPKSVTPSPTTSPTSSSSSVSGTEPRGGRLYANPPDWTQHREIITSLYESKRLKDVIKIMKTDHNFAATERMYKARFKEWGLRKNVTASEVHKLMFKVEQHLQTAQNQPHPSDLAAQGDRQASVLDVGDDLDVKRIQKYMKRNPAGLKKLRNDPKRPLDVIKALSVEGSKGRAGRGKVSVPTSKLEQRGRSSTMLSPPPPPGLMLAWGGSGLEGTDDLPDDITSLIHRLGDEDFSAPHPYTTTTTATTSQLPFTSSMQNPWQPQGHSHNAPLESSMTPLYDRGAAAPDETMLSFAIRLRAAHMMFDEGLMNRGSAVVHYCMSLLSSRYQQAQSMDGREAARVLLYALSAALEMAADFGHHDVLPILFQNISIVCGTHNQTMAEICRRISQLRGTQQSSAIKLARQMISSAAFGYDSSDDRGFEVYARSVDVTVCASSSPKDKMQGLQELAAEPMVQSCEHLRVWMEQRIALAVRDGPWTTEQQHQHGPWESSGMASASRRMAAVLRYLSARVECHKIAGNWPMAAKLALECKWLAEACGCDEMMARKFGEDVEALRSPMVGGGMAESAVPMVPMASMASMEPVNDHLAFSLPETAPSWHPHDQAGAQAPTPSPYQGMADGWMGETNVLGPDLGGLYESPF